MQRNTGGQLKFSFEILYQAIENNPEMAAPNKPPIKETENTFTMGLLKLLNKNLILLCMKLAPLQMQKESKIK